MLEGQETGGDTLRRQDRKVHVGHRKIQLPSQHRWALEDNWLAVYNSSAKMVWEDMRQADPEGTSRWLQAHIQLTACMEDSLQRHICFIMPDNMHVEPDSAHNAIMFECLAQESSCPYELGVLLDSRFTLAGLECLMMFCSLCAVC